MTILALLGWSSRLAEPEAEALLLREMLRDLPRERERLLLLSLLRDRLSRAPAPAPFACSRESERALDLCAFPRAGVRDRDRPRDVLRRSGEDILKGVGCIRRDMR